MANHFSFSKKRPWLLPFAFLYGLGIDMHEFLLRKNILKSVEFDIPVINIGNLSVGGTGKTPHVIETIKILSEQYKCGLVTRGYGRKTKGVFLSESEDTALDIGDEPLMIKQQFPEMPLAVAEKRIWGIVHLLENHPETEVIILDDAMQHRRLNPGFNILTTAFHQPFYDSLLLPAGDLRERRRSAGRADMIVVSKCPQNITAAEKMKIKDRVSVYTSAPVVFTGISYQELTPLFDDITQSQTANTKKLLVAAIADPEPLLNMMQQKGIQPETMFFRDHHIFSEADMEKISAWQEKNKGIIITTEKDAARLYEWENFIKNRNLPIFVQRIGVSYCAEDDRKTFHSLIHEYVKKQLEYYKS